MDENKLKAKIRKQWDIPGLLVDLRRQKWRPEEKNRIVRMHWIGDYATIERMAREAFPSKEWREAAAEGFEGEIVDEYIMALGDVLIESTGGELRREHVYVTFENGDAYIGQYEDMAAEHLEAMGFEIER